MQRGRLWWNIFIMHAILSEKLALREAAVWPMQWCAQTRLRRVWCAVSMIILKDLYFIENNIRILNSVAHGQKQQFDITQWRDATHYTQWGCTYTKERNDVYHEVWDGARGGLFRRRKGDAQTGPPQDWPLSDHSVPQDDTALPETVLHFVLLYLTFPGISVNFLVLSLYLNSFWKDPNTTVLISNPIKGEKKNAEEDVASSVGRAEPQHLHLWAFPVGATEWPQGLLSIPATLLQLDTPSHLI